MQWLCIARGRQRAERRRPGRAGLRTPHDYRCAITALAQDPALLAGYRRHLAEQRMELPLFDSGVYVREFERLLARMVARWRAGLPAEHLLADTP
ncbi:MAG: hypothetical protein H7Z19_06780 [Chitinophagaceae bacterium]|nr:hypothetical protein [Rubrivivax sp.]